MSRPNTASEQELFELEAMRTILICLPDDDVLACSERAAALAKIRRRTEQLWPKIRAERLALRGPTKNMGVLRAAA